MSRGIPSKIPEVSPEIPKIPLDQSLEASVNATFKSFGRVHNR